MLPIPLTDRGEVQGKYLLLLAYPAISPHNTLVQGKKWFVDLIGQHRSFLHYDNVD